MANKGVLKCGNENECCGCCKLSLGIKFVGAWLIFEVLIQLLTISANGTGLVAIVNILLFILALVSVVMFIWSMCKIEDVKPRDYWLKAFMAEFVIGILCQLIMLAVMNFGDALRAKCIAEFEASGYKVLDDGNTIQPDSNREFVAAQAWMYSDVNKCVAAEKFIYNLFGVTVLVIFLVLRIYFAI